MNWDTVEGRWIDLKGRIRERWGKLTDDDHEQIEGKRERLEGKLRERYGWAKDKVDSQIDAFLTAI